MMDHLVLRDREFDVDLESGGTSSEEERGNEVCENTCHNKFFDRFWCGPLSFDQSINAPRVQAVGDENLELLIDKDLEEEQSQQHTAIVDRKCAEERSRKKNHTKAPKPPRPPKGPLLDAVDQKLIQEIAELAMRKRARIKRIKALKKMRAAKASSWSNSSAAMVITILFCLILIFQGICSRNNGIIVSRVSSHPAVAGGGLISVQFLKNFSAHGSDTDRPGMTLQVLQKAKLPVSLVKL